MGETRVIKELATQGHLLGIEADAEGQGCDRLLVET
jgi:hypothetical protein